jgi:hypothetical protein
MLMMRSLPVSDHLRTLNAPPEGFNAWLQKSNALDLINGVRIPGGQKSAEKLDLLTASSQKVIKNKDTNV